MKSYEVLGNLGEMKTCRFENHEECAARQLDGTANAVYK